MPFENPGQVSDVSAVKEKINTILREVNPTEGQKKPPFVYHYCAAEGLHGILSPSDNGHCVLWATDMFCLNDGSEMTYGFELIKEIVGAHPSLGGYFNGDLIPKLINMLNSHVVCFSTDGDLLSQWRAYGSSGRGFRSVSNAQNSRNTELKMIASH